MYRIRKHGIAAVCWFVGSAALLWISGTASLQAQTATAVSPPVAAMRPVTDDYFGRQVVDPYRYMENLKDPAVEAWFKAQNNYTREALARIPGRSGLLARIKALNESAPAAVSDIRRMPDGRYFYRKRLASEDIAKLYTRMGLDGQETLLVDPTSCPLPKAGTIASVTMRLRSTGDGWRMGFPRAARRMPFFASSRRPRYGKPAKP
jgi:hypothetical protein